MARKSAQRRLEELLALREQFKKNPAAAQFHNWTVGFIDSMIIKLKRGKGLTKKMRDKIDSIVEEGVPAIPDSREADEVEKWGKFLDSQGESILLDFANRMRKGWNLSEKQIAFRDRLVEQAKHNQNNGFWEKDVAAYTENWKRHCGDPKTQGSCLCVFLNDSRYHKSVNGHSPLTGKGDEES